jgi:hypothetical protein
MKNTSMFKHIVSVVVITGSMIGFRITALAQDANGFRTPLGGGVDNT